MLGFLAEYTGKTCGYIADLAEDAWEDTKSISERFTQGYESVSTPTHQNNEEIKTEQEIPEKVEPQQENEGE